MNKALSEGQFTAKKILDEIDPAIKFTVSYEKEEKRVKSWKTLGNCVYLKFKAYRNGDLLQVLKKANDY